MLFWRAGASTSGSIPLDTRRRLGKLLETAAILELLGADPAPGQFFSIEHSLAENVQPWHYFAGERAKRAG